jgi:hypothetical protein
MKDAVVRIGGCTGVVVSGRGLVLTNHHCALVPSNHTAVLKGLSYRRLLGYVGDGELPNPGLTVTFLVRMEDVTGEY